MSQIAIPWLVLQHTGNPVLTGLVAAAEIAPYVVLQILGAPLVDRFGGRRIATIGNTIASAAMATIWLFELHGPTPVLAVLALVFLAGMVRGPGDAATGVLLPPVARMSGSSIDRAAGLVDGSSRLAQVIGALSGGTLIAVIGANQVVLIDSISFICAVLLIAVIPASAGNTQGAGGSRIVEPYSRRLLDGLRYVRRSPLIRSITGTLLFANFADAAMTGLLLLLWAAHGSAGTLGIGYVSAAFGGGALIGAILQALFGSATKRRRTFAWSFLLCGAPRFIALALPLPLLVIVLIWAVSGIGEGAINPILSAAEYDTIPRQLQARVIAATRAIAYSGIPLGPLAAAGLVSTVGFTRALLVLCALYLAVSISPFALSTWSQLDPTSGSLAATKEKNHRRDA